MVVDPCQMMAIPYVSPAWMLSLLYILNFCGHLCVCARARACV